MENRPIVVFVDSDTAFANSVRNGFTAAGYAVEVCGDADSAEPLAARLKPDIVVTDMILPGKSGFWLLERLKGHDPRLPVIMAATLAGPAQRQFAEFLGADDFLTRPVAVSRLLESVRRFCSPGVNPPHRSPLPSRLRHAANGA